MCEKRVLPLGVRQTNFLEDAGRFSRKASVLPFEGVDKMIHIGLDKINYRCQRVIFGSNTEVERTAHEMIVAVGEEKLQGGCSIRPSYFIYNTMNTLLVPSYQCFINGLCFNGVLVGEIPAIFQILFK